jgi:hypothetical protein
MAVGDSGSTPILIVVPMIPSYSPTAAVSPHERLVIIGECIASLVVVVAASRMREAEGH